MTIKTIDPIHRVPTVKLITGLSRSTIYRLIQENKFPRPIKLGERASGWRQSDLEEWVESRASASNEEAAK
ncbi:MAG: AlpA family transcriptional regulator [Halothiobacillaceae bacterium]|nr:AlpA family transcriptional regulator [Halothiobacillaceae bacterium]